MPISGRSPWSHSWIGSLISILLFVCEAGCCTPTIAGLGQLSSLDTSLGSQKFVPTVFFVLGRTKETHETSTIVKCCGPQMLSQSFHLKEPTTYKNLPAQEHHVKSCESSKTDMILVAANISL